MGVEGGKWDKWECCWGSVGACCVAVHHAFSFMPGSAFRTLPHCLSFYKDRLRVLACQRAFFARERHENAPRRTSARMGSPAYGPLRECFRVTECRAACRRASRVPGSAFRLLPLLRTGSALVCAAFLHGFTTACAFIICVPCHSSLCNNATVTRSCPSPLRLTCTISTASYIPSPYCVLRRVLQGWYTTRSILCSCLPPEFVPAAQHLSPHACKAARHAAACHTLPRCPPRRRSAFQLRFYTRRLQAGSAAS